MQKNKYVFANLATGYLLNSLNGMAEKLRRDSKLDSWYFKRIESFLLEVFDKTKPANDLEQTVEHFFPWIKPIIEKVGIERENDRLTDAYRVILMAFCEQLDKVRNFYTHVNHPPIQTIEIKLPLEDGKNKTVPFSLNWIYDGAVNMIKERFKAEENEVAHLRRKNRGRMV